MKKYLEDKQMELVRALGQQDYSLQDIADIFGLTKSKVYRIINSTPEDWISPWVKR